MLVLLNHLNYLHSTQTHIENHFACITNEYSDIITQRKGRV